MILAQNWPKTAKSSWQCPFKVFAEPQASSNSTFKINILFQVSYFTLKLCFPCSNCFSHFGRFQCPIPMEPPPASPLLPLQVECGSLRRRTFDRRARNDGGSWGWVKHDCCQGKLEKEGSRVTATYTELEQGEAQVEWSMGFGGRVGESCGQGEGGGGGCDAPLSLFSFDGFSFL